MAVAGVTAVLHPRAHASFAQREVDVSARPLPAGSHLVIVVHAPGTPPVMMEYIVDTAQPDDALRVGLGYAREFIDGRLH